METDAQVLQKSQQNKKDRRKERHDKFLKSESYCFYYTVSSPFLDSQEVQLLIRSKGVKTFLLV